jgi:hypothetical protein
MATQTANTSNSQPIADAIADRCYDFGKQEGDGLVARSNFCDYITARAKDGECTVDHASEYWAKYAAGAHDALADTGEKVKDELAQRAADLKHYITLGANKMLDGPELLANARLVLSRMRDSGTAKGLKTWDVMLVWLRAQNKSNERAMHDSEIEDLFLARAKRATDELDRLSGVANVLKKQCDIYEDERTRNQELRAKAEENGDDPDDAADEDLPEGIQGVQTALELVQNRIADLGGTRKDQRKAERARIRADKEAAKLAAKHASP